MINRILDNIKMGKIYKIYFPNGKYTKAMATETNFYRQGWCFEGIHDMKDYNPKDVIKAELVLK